MGWMFVELGAPNPRLNAFGDINERLAGLIHHWKAADPEPARVKPIPIAILHIVHHIAMVANTVGMQCIANMIWMAFYFLCRLGKYTVVAAKSRPFWFQDMQLWLGACRLNLTLATAGKISNATCLALTFTDQKNCMWGEVIAQGCLGSSTACAT